MSKLLVTGGAGFMGSNFVVRSIQRDPGLDITVVDSLTYAGDLKNLSEVESSINFIKGDICDQGLVDSLVAKSDIIVNFAAETHNDNSLLDPSPFMRTNILGVFTLISATRKHSKRFHQISTDEVFGDLPINGSEQFVESSPMNPSSPYSASKASGDMLVRSWHRSFGLAATISNSSNNFGKNQNPEKLIPNAIRAAQNDQPITVYGNGQNIRDWIHVDSHTDGVWSILNHGRIGETYLLGSRAERTNIQVVTHILKTLGKPEELLTFVADRPGHDRRYGIDPSKAEAELGWRSSDRSFEDQLTEVIGSYL